MNELNYGDVALRVAKVYLLGIMGFTILGFAACSSTGTTSPSPVAQGAISLCNAAGNSLQVLAAARAQGKLSPTQVAEVHDAEALTDPVCTASTPPSDAVAAARAFAIGLASLVELQKTVK